MSTELAAFKPKKAGQSAISRKYYYGVGKRKWFKYRGYDI